VNWRERKKKVLQKKYIKNIPIRKLCFCEGKARELYYVLIGNDMTMEKVNPSKCKYRPSLEKHFD
jgi:hypothetical protein